MVLFLYAALDGGLLYSLQFRPRARLPLLALVEPALLLDLLFLLLQLGLPLEQLGVLGLEQLLLLLELRSDQLDVLLLLIDFVLGLLLQLRLDHVLTELVKGTRHRGCVLSVHQARHLKEALLNLDLSFLLASGLQSSEGVLRSLEVSSSGMDSKQPLFTDTPDLNLLECDLPS